MPVTYLELENFKSYGGLQRIGPFRDFTCIIGPNGSGKSNLMDAISFVFGVQSRDLRSSQMKDLIYRPPGAIADKGKKGKNKLSARATLYYSTESKKSKKKSRGTNNNDEDDDGESNDSSTTLGDGEEDANDENTIIFSRHITSSGQGGYSVNGKPVIYKEYERELCKIGIIVSARNFLVFQGDVENLARKTPKELTALIENIATSNYSADKDDEDDEDDEESEEDEMEVEKEKDAEGDGEKKDNEEAKDEKEKEATTTRKKELTGRKLLQQEYQNALVKKDETNATTLFLYNQNKTYKSERKIFKEQKAEADKYFSLKEEHAKTKANYFLWQLFHINTKKEESENKIEKELRVKHEELQNQEKENAENLQEQKKTLSVLRKDASNLDKQRMVLQNQHDNQYRTQLIECTESIKNVEKKLGQHSKSIEKTQKQIEKQKETVQNLDNEIKEYNETKQSLDEEYEQTKKDNAAKGSSVALTNEQEQELEELRDKAAAASVNTRKQLATQNRRLESARSQVQNTSSELQQAKQAHQEAKETSEEFKEREEKLSSSIQTTSASIKESEKKLVEVQSIITQRNQRIHQIDMKLEQVNKTLYDYKDSYRRNRDEQKLLNAILQLQRHFGKENVHGRLVDLCKPSQKKYQLAVTVAAGKDMDAIVVSSQQVGFDCIRYLRDQRIGTATFLPLDRLSVPSPESLERIRSMSTSNAPFRLAIDCIIPANEIVQKAVLYAVSNTIICDDLDSARHVCFGSSNRRGGNRPQQSRFKAVTLGGAVISKAGTMTGGITRDDTKKANRWNEQEIEKLREEKDKLENERNELSNNTGRTTITTRDADGNERTTTTSINYSAQLEELRNNLGTLRNSEQYAKSDLRYTKKQMKEKQALCKSLEKQVTKMESQLSNGEKEIGNLKERIEALRTEIQTIENNILDPFRKETGIQDLQAYSELISKARSEYNAKKRSIIEHITKLEQKREYESSRNFEKTLKNLNKKIENCDKDLERLHAEERKIMKSIDDLKAQLEEIERQTKEAAEKEKEQEETVSNAQNEFTEIHNERLKAGRALSAEESALERLRSKLHETLQKARVDEVDLPMVDVEGEGETDKEARATRAAGPGSTSQSSSEDENPSQKENSMNIMTQYSQENDPKVAKDKVFSERIDYQKLDPSLQEMVPNNDKEESKYKKEFEDSLSKIWLEIESMSPNMKATEAFNNITDKLKLSTKEYDRAKRNAKKASLEFQRIKAKRAKMFNDAFNHIDTALKTIYTDMTKSSKHPLGGNAYLSLDDNEEPYNGGLKFNAMPPMKRFRDMEQLSGGEKTVAALSLLFAIHSYHPAPFFVMDEVDAALDNINLRKVCNYISQRSQTDFQCIVISLKDMFYERSGSLVGICRDVGSNSSATLTLDLVKFDKNEVKEQTTNKTRGAKRSHGSSSGPSADKRVRSSSRSRRGNSG